MTDPMQRLEQDFARILGQIVPPVGPVPVKKEDGADEELSYAKVA